MRPLKQHEWVFCAIVVAAVAYFAYEAVSMMHRNADLTAPPKQPTPDDFEAQARLGWFRAIDGHSVLCHPEEHHAGYTYTPHRFPRTIGANITAAIHHGYSVMRVPNVQDVQWIISPPSEVAW
ncbi:MAG TPA: hypothetical protein VF821_06305 [Lentzea sp.]